MVKIPEATVESISAELDAIYEDEEEFAALHRSFMEQQPAVVAFIMAVGDEELSEDTLGLVLFMGVRIWFIFDAASPSGMPPVSTEKLMESFDKRETWLQSMVRMGEAETISQPHIPPEMPQEFVLQNVVSHLTGILVDPEGEVGLSEMEMVNLFWILLTVIDAFDATFQEVIEGGE